MYTTVPSLPERSKLCGRGRIGLTIIIDVMTVFGLSSSAPVNKTMYTAVPSLPERSKLCGRGRIGLTIIIDVMTVFGLSSTEQATTE